MCVFSLKGKLVPALPIPSSEMAAIGIRDWENQVFAFGDGDGAMGDGGASEFYCRVSITLALRDRSPSTATEVRGWRMARPVYVARTRNAEC